MYYIPRIIKKCNLSSIKNSFIDKNSRIESGSQVINSTMDRFSFCGYNCIIINTSIGAFSSIASNVKIGLASHPIDWVSTSPAFYYGRDSIKKNFACKNYVYSKEKTIIGNDVWIGENCLIKSGVTIGDGSVVGMGSVVTKNIPPYEIWAGNPAHFIRKRFDNQICNSLIKIKWWEFSEDKLKELGCYIDNPNEFIIKFKK